MARKKAKPTGKASRTSPNGATSKVKKVLGKVLQGAAVGALVGAVEAVASETGTLSKSGGKTKGSKAPPTHRAAAAVSG